MSSQDKQEVLNYLQNANRPYSASDIILNMHNRCSKTAVQKALDKLVEESKIREKTYGKQKVYCVLQNQEDCSKDIQKELDDLECQINEKNGCLKSLEEKIKTLGNQCDEMQALLTTDEAEKKKKQLQEAVNNLKTKLALLTENKIEISKENVLDIKAETEKIVKEYRKRKRICTDIINAILEGYPKPKKTLFEEVGIEPDDDTNTPVV